MVVVVVTSIMVVGIITEGNSDRHSSNDESNSCSSETD